MFKKFLKDKSGATSMLFVLMAFILIFIIGGARNIMFKKLTISEVKNTADIAGVSALRASVNNDEHRLEHIGNPDIINLTQARTMFMSMMKSCLDNQKFIESWYIDPNQITVEYDSDDWRFDDSKERNEAFINAVIHVRYKTGFFDNSDIVSGFVYNSKTNNKFDVQYVGKTNDGLGEVIIYSSSRIVFK